MDSLKAELKAMEKIAKILHDLPSTDSVVRVSEWLREVVRTEYFPAKAGDEPVYATIEKQLESLPPSELEHIANQIGQLIGQPGTPEPPTTHDPVNHIPIVPQSPA